MKKNIKWIILAVLLIGIIVGASFLYNKLSHNYHQDHLMNESQIQDDTESKNVNTAPNFTVLDHEGNEVKLSDYQGTPVVLNFWATWCYYCKLEMPDFNEAYQKYPDVQFLMVNATDGTRETISSAKEYIHKENFQFDIFFDTQLEAVNAYYVTGFPSTFFIDKEGYLIAYANGRLDMDALEKGISMIKE